MGLLQPLMSQSQTLGSPRPVKSPQPVGSPQLVGSSQFDVDGIAADHGIAGRHGLVAAHGITAITAAHSPDTSNRGSALPKGLEPAGSLGRSCWNKPCTDECSIAERAHRAGKSDPTNGTTPWSCRSGQQHLMGGKFAGFSLDPKRGP